jgi:hypothetical protein
VGDSIVSAHERLVRQVDALTGLVLVLWAVTFLGIAGVIGFAIAAHRVQDVAALWPLLAVWGFILWAASRHAADTRREMIRADAMIRTIQANAHAVPGLPVIGEPSDA